MREASISDAVREIVNAWPIIKSEFIRVSPGRYLVLNESYRSPERQLELFKSGRVYDPGTDTWLVVDKSKVVTNVDGVKVLGAHNYFPSRAIDVAVVDNQSGKVLWEESHYQCLIGIAESVGLVSGGSWKSFKDWPHIELKDYKNYRGAV